MAELAPWTAADPEAPLVLDRVTHLVFGGGGIRGYCYFGCIAALRDVLDLTYAGGYAAWSERLEFAAGTSIGALFALFAVLELEPGCLRALLRPDGTLSHDLLPRPSTQAMSMLAIDDGRTLCRMAARLLAERNFADSITMRGLRRCTGKLLRCTVFNALSMQAEYLDADTAPDMRVVDAVAASMRVPLVYAAHVDHARRAVYTDGGGVDNFALDALPAGLAADRVLGLRTRPGSETLDFQDAAQNGRLCLARALLGPLAALDAALFNRQPAALRARVVTIDTGAVTGIELQADAAVCAALWTAGSVEAYRAIHPARGAAVRVVTLLLRAAVEARFAVARHRALARAVRRVGRLGHSGSSSSSAASNSNASANASANQAAASAATLTGDAATGKK